MAQHNATLRKSFRSALASKKLADVLIDGMAELQNNFNAAMAQLDVDSIVPAPAIAATAAMATTSPIHLTSVATGAARNTNTFTSVVSAAAANPTNTVLATFAGTAAAITCTIVPNDGTNNPASAQATASIATTTPIILTSVARGTGRNTNTFTIQVLAAAANPTNTVLVAFTGTGAAIVCTVTPNDGTNNSATPVDLTTAQLVTLINSGAVATVTLTDTLSLRALQTATGGGAAALADAGEGDGVVGTFSGGTTVAVNITTAQLVELIGTGLISGKVITLTDTSSRRALQTATGGGAAALVHSGEGDGVVGTFSGGVNADLGLNQNYVASDAALGLITPDARMSSAPHQATYRKALRSAFANKKLADSFIDTMAGMQTNLNLLLAKLDAEAGTLDDTDFASTLTETVILPDAAESGVQYQASMRKALRSALAHKHLADLLLDSIAAWQTSFNAALVQLDTGTISGAMAAFEVTAINPDLS